MKRRNFLLTSMAGAATAALAPSTVLASCAPKKANATPLNLCFQEGIALGANLQEKLDYCESLGVTGFEVGGRGLAGRVDEINNALKGRNVRMAAICAGFDGFILAEDGQKDEFDRTMREIIQARSTLVASLWCLPSTGRSLAAPTRWIQETTFVNSFTNLASLQFNVEQLSSWSP